MSRGLRVSYGSPSERDRPKGTHGERPWFPVTKSFWEFWDSSTREAFWGPSQPWNEAIELPLERYRKDLSNGIKHTPNAQAVWVQQALQGCCPVQGQRDSRLRESLHTRGGGGLAEGCRGYCMEGGAGRAGLTAVKHSPGANG